MNLAVPRSVYTCKYAILALFYMPENTGSLNTWRCPNMFLETTCFSFLRLLAGGEGGEFLTTHSSFLLPSTPLHSLFFDRHVPLLADFRSCTWDFSVTRSITIRQMDACIFGRTKALCFKWPPLKEIGIKSGHSDWEASSYWVIRGRLSATGPCRSRTSGLLLHGPGHAIPIAVYRPVYTVI